MAEGEGRGRGGSEGGEGGEGVLGSAELRLDRKEI